METLIKELEAYKKSLSAAEKVQLSDSVLDKLYAVYPFNKFEYTISHLIAKGVISLDEYLEMRAEYLQRNKYLHLFELAPRTFGETWGQNHLMELVPEFKIPTKRLDPTFSGEYDLLLNDIHVEVKASRAVKKVGGDTLANKALASNSTSKFDMNYQQLKPGCCDVFVWIAVWRDKIDYWVMSSEDVQNNPLLSNQHRASQLSESGEVVEGQSVVDSVKQGDKIEKVTIIRQGEEAKKFTATQSDFDRLQKEVIAENDRKEKAAFAKLIDGCEKTNSGIYYKINKNGKGDKPSKGQTVTTEYIGKLTNGQIFDASQHFHPQGHAPLTFKVGAGEMIPGFDEMVLDMKVGEIRYMLLPPELAYGARGIPQAGIPGNARLIFEVERTK